MIETAAERAAMANDWDVAALTGGGHLHGWYDGASSDDLSVSGYSPTYRATRDSLVSLGVDVGTGIESISTATGQTLGAFVVRVLRPEDDGQMVVLQLEAGT